MTHYPAVTFSVVQAGSHLCKCVDPFAGPKPEAPQPLSLQVCKALLALELTRFKWKGVRILQKKKMIFLKDENCPS